MTTMDRFTRGKRVAGSRRRVAVVVSALLVCSSAAAGPDDWQGFASAGLTEHHTGQTAVMVVGAGVRSQALVDATRALRDVYAASGKASLVMNDQALGDVTGLGDADIVKQASARPISHVAIVRVYGDRVVVTLYDSWGKVAFSVSVRKSSRKRQAQRSIEREVFGRYPWLTRLTDHRRIARRFADVTRAEQATQALRREWANLPDPAATIISDNKARRQHARDAVGDEIARRRRHIRKLSAPIEIEIGQILRDNFATRHEYPERWSRAIEQAGRRALVAELTGRRATVRMWRHGIGGRFPWSMGVYVDGTWLVCQPDGLHLDALIEPRQVTSSALQLAGVFFDAIIATGTSSMQDAVDRSPFLAEVLLDRFISRMDEAAFSRRLLQEDELTLRELGLERKRVAGEMKVHAVAALAPIMIVATLLVIDGPADLMLTLMPAHKLGKAYRSGRKLMSSRRTRKLMDEFGDAVNGSDEMKQFMRLASQLRPAERRALKTIKARSSKTVARELMHRHIAGKADVVWIADKLKRNKLDGAFVRRFTDYQAGPSWDTLKKVVENRQVSEKARTTLARRVTGLLGEEAAARIARSKAFVAQYFGTRGRRYQVRRSARYNDQGGSMDLVVLNDGDVVLGEVKNWGEKGWRNARARTSILNQLERHNGGEAVILTEVSRRKRNVKKKLLMVAENGYVKGMTKAEQAAFKDELDDRGWVLHRIPSHKIESFGDFITRIQ